MGLEENSNIDYIKKVSKTFDEMDVYFSKLIEERKKVSSTKDNDDNDSLISRIIRTKVDGHLIRRRNTYFFPSSLNAAHITTVNLIGNSIFSLLNNPQELKRLQQNKKFINQTCNRRDLKISITRTIRIVLQMMM